MRNLFAFLDFMLSSTPTPATTETRWDVINPDKKISCIVFHKNGCTFL